MTNNSKYFFIFVLVFFSLSCLKKESSNNSKLISFQRIYSSDDFQVSKDLARGGTVIKNKDDLLLYWNKLNTSQDMPDIDFTRNMVIAFYVGEKPTNGYSININQIEQKDNIINVNYVYKEPGPDFIKIYTLTYPVYIVKLEKTDLNVKFVGAKK